jgi:type II restriction enzyme
MNEKQKITPEEVYRKLIEEDKITSVEGQIRFFLGSVDIIVKQRDVVGNIIQEWLEGWLKQNNIWYANNPNTQMPPDIFLDSDHTKDLLEVKAFNSCASPAFDIADFKAYVREIVDKPYMLHTKYIIFGYNMSDDGIVTIKNLWLKNIWEISRSSNNWPINVQYKNGVIQKIRPATWYSESKRFPLFERLEDYLSALEETMFMYPDTHNIAKNWRKNMQEAYKAHYGITLDIPRWHEIESKYHVIE